MAEAFVGLGRKVLVITALLTKVQLRFLLFLNFIFSSCKTAKLAVSRCDTFQPMNDYKQQPYQVLWWALGVLTHWSWCHPCTKCSLWAPLCLAGFQKYIAALLIILSAGALSGFCIHRPHKKVLNAKLTFLHLKCRPVADVFLILFSKKKIYWDTQLDLQQN